MSDDLFGFLRTRGPEHYMLLALREARRAARSDEVPVGAVIVDAPSGRVIARAHNQRELLEDPTAHAEIIALTQAAAHYRSWRLTDAVLFVTLEPCLMCSGAIVQARLPRVYYGARDPKAGAHASVFEVLVDPRNNHVPEVISGVRESECAALLTEFFRAKRGTRPGNGETPPTSGTEPEPGNR